MPEVLNSKYPGDGNARLNAFVRLVKFVTSGWLIASQSMSTPSYPRDCTKFTIFETKVDNVDQLVALIKSDSLPAPPTVTTTFTLWLSAAEIISEEYSAVSPLDV